jgi:hypothetical protein
LAFFDSQGIVASAVAAQLERKRDVHIGWPASDEDAKAIAAGSGFPLGTLPKGIPRRCAGWE